MADISRRLKALSAMTVERGCTVAEAAVAARKLAEIKAKNKPEVGLRAALGQVPPRELWEDDLYRMCQDIEKAIRRNTVRDVEEALYKAALRAKRR